MKAILMSIQEQHNKNIESGLKISELRTRPPKIKPPFRVYTYESGTFGRHKVVNEWICKSMTEWRICMGIPATLPRNACVSVAEIREYSGKDYKNITEMGISDLKIYDKPKELGEFKQMKSIRGYHKRDEKKLDGINTERLMHGTRIVCKVLTRPPQSWCYVEELL